MNTSPQVRRCVEAAKQGDSRCRAVLLGASMPTVRAIALRYDRLGLPLDDLVQEGSLGVMEAIDRYDPARSDDFESYARFRIRRAIRDALTSKSRLIRLPKHVIERRRAVAQVDAAVLAATGHTPTPAEIAAATSLSSATVIALRTVGAPLVSLDQPVCDDGSTLETMIVDHLSNDPLSTIARRDEEESVDAAVAALPERQKRVVSRHFGLGCREKPLAEVAAELHVSPQRARAIEQDALFALRQRLYPKFPGA